MNQERFISLVKAEQEPLRRFLLGLCCGDDALADDIAQDALVRAYVASSNFLGLSKFSTWLFRIAYNCFIDRKRSQKWQAEPIDERTESVEGGNSADAAFRHEALYRAIRQLPEKERAALLLFYMEDRPVKEVAAILDIPASSVRAYLTRGRQHIKAFLEKWKTR